MYSYTDSNDEVGGEWTETYHWGVGVRGFFWGPDSYPLKQSHSESTSQTGMTFRGTLHGWSIDPSTEVMSDRM